MKVFISHSSRDKWAARRISDDLIAIDATTFLDEKDIKTGESIDVRIQDNLTDCDDLMILVSPDSVNSQWVLIELGGAIALKKNIIPIFLYVGSNEIPKPISKLLGRDINDIDKYYDEIKLKISGKTVAKAKKKTPEIIDTKFKVGDKVRLPLKPVKEETAPGWVDDMDRYLGLNTTIKKLGNEDGIPFAKVDVDNMDWEWATSWLVKIE